MFGDAFLQHPIPGYTNFQQAFPNAKFVFPTAAWRRAAAFKRQPITQWFDMWDILRPGFKDELQIEGLRESCKFWHDLIKQEAAVVGMENVLVGGLSQGCATMLIALLFWTDRSSPVAFGMCGRLPYEAKIREEFEYNKKGHNRLIDMGYTSRKDDLGSPAAEAQNWLNWELEYGPPIGVVAEHTVNKTAIFLCHGPKR